MSTKADQHRRHFLTQAGVSVVGAAAFLLAGSPTFFDSGFIPNYRIGRWAQQSSGYDKPIKEIAKAAGLEHFGILVGDGRDLALKEFVRTQATTGSVPLTWGHQVSIKNGKPQVDVSYTKWVGNILRALGKPLTINHLVFPGAMKTMDGQDWFAANDVSKKRETFLPIFDATIQSMIKLLNGYLRTAGSVVSVVNETYLPPYRTEDAFGEILGYGDFTDDSSDDGGYVVRAFNVATQALARIGLKGVWCGISETSGSLGTDRSGRMIRYLIDEKLADIVLLQAHEQTDPDTTTVRMAADLLDSWGVHWRFSEVSGQPDYIAEVAVIAARSKGCDGLIIWEDPQWVGHATIIDENGDYTPGYYAMYDALRAVSLSMES